MAARMRKRALFAAWCAFALFLASAVPLGGGTIDHAAIIVPVIILAAAWGAGMVAGYVVILAAVSAALSFAAQALMAKGSSSGPSPTMDSGQVKIEQQQSIRQPASARRVVYGRAKVGGVFALQMTTNGNQYLYFCLMLAGHEVEKIREIYFDDELLIFEDPDTFGEVSEGKFKGVVHVSANRGTDDQEADAYLRANIPTRWNANDRLRGIANICGRLVWDNTSGDGTIGSKVWSGGMPNITVVLDGYNKIFDPRTDTTGYTSNSALCIADYLTNQQWGRKATYADRINDALLIAAANICDEDIALSGGGTEKRYSTDGSFLTDAPPDSILGKMLATMHGEAIFDGNRWNIFAGAYQPPSITLTDDDMRAPSKLSTLTSARDSFNGVKGTYTGPGVAWTEADFPAIQSSSMLERDGGREQWKDIELPFVISSSRARRIAKIDLLLTRQEIVEQFYGKISCYRVTAGTIIYRDSERYGWTQKPFKVASGQIGVSGDPPVIGFDLVLQETTEDAWDWSTSEDVEADPAPNTDFPNIFPLPPVAPFTATETLYQASPAMPWQSRMRFQWGAPNDAFVTSGGGYLLRYRRVGDANWTPVPQSREPYHVEDSLVEGNYEAQVRTVSWAGIASTAFLSLDFEVLGLSAPPSPPQNFNVVPLAGGTVAHATWDQATDIDVLRGGFIHVRHSVLTTGATWANSVSISRAMPGDSTEALLPLKAGTYLAKAVDVGGYFSSDFTPFVQSQDSAWDFVTVASLDEGPDFSGAKTNCVVGVDDFLRLDDLGVPIGTYVFDDIIDLGMVLNVRVTSIIDAFAENSGDTIDGRATPVDTWPDWDGAPIGVEADVYCEMRKTNDDPSGSPTWSEWQRFHAVEARAWGLQFRAILISNDPAFTPAVMTLGVVAEEVGAGT